MFERFTKRARKVVFDAQQEAYRFNHTYIGTEHLLLGLIREGEGIAAQTLGALGVTLREARQQVEDTVGFGEEDSGEQAPFTPRSKKVIERALRESLNLGHTYIGTEHLLLGLVRERDGVAARVLSNLDVDRDRVRREVIRRLEERGEEPGDEPGSEALTRLTEQTGMESGADLGYQELTIDAKVSGLEVEAHYGGVEQPRKLLVDLEYDYGEISLSGQGAQPSPEVLAAGVAEHLAERQLSSLADGVSQTGSYVMERVSVGRKLVVTLTVPHAGASLPAFGLSVTGVSVTGTFVV